MSGGFSGEVHTVFSYQGSKFDLENKNPNLLVAYIGCSPANEQVEKYIRDVYGPKIPITHDPKATAPAEESLEYPIIHCAFFPSLSMQRGKWRLDWTNTRRLLTPFSSWRGRLVATCPPAGGAKVNTLDGTFPAEPNQPTHNGASSKNPFSYSSANTG